MVARSAGVLAALSLGDQNAIAHADWALLRDTGAMPGAFGPCSGDADLAALRAAALAEPGTDGIDSDTAAIGVVLERLVIRRLYGRMVDTMLATWGLSLLLVGIVAAWTAIRESVER